MLLKIRHDFNFSTWHLALGVAVICISILWQVRTIKNAWVYAQGFEQQWVADSLLKGHGYSFDPVTAWLGPYGDGEHYSPTAWVEPLYTFTIAAMLGVFGEYGYLVLCLLNVIWLGLSALLIFRLTGEIMDPRVGLYTSSLFLIFHASQQDVLLYVGNTALAGLLYCLCAYLLLRCIKDPTLHACGLLGITIGIANLNHAGALLLVPLSVLLLLIGLGIRNSAAWRASLLITPQP